MTRVQDKPFEPDRAIYTPAETSRYGLQRIEDIQANQNRALRFFIPGISDYIAPLLPGQVCGIIGQTSNYKSGFIDAWEEAEATRLNNEGRTNECIVHVSVEETVEEQAFRGFARESGISMKEISRGEIQDWNQLERAAIKIGNIPIYRIGDSLARAEDFPRLYLSNMIRAIRFLRDELLENKIEIAALFFDYLQAFPIDPEVARADIENQRRLQVREDVYRLMSCARLFKAPTVVNVQAKQMLTGAPSKKLYIPGKYDGEETSSIGQRWDRLIGLWMPKSDLMPGEEVEWKGINYTVEENLLFVRALKQRGGLPSGRIWKCRIDFNRNRILQEVIEGMNPFDGSFEIRS